MEIPRKGRPNTWGVRTPLHLNPATGKRERYWIGREYLTKTAAEKALSKWHTDHEAGQIRVSSDMRLGEWLDKWLTNLRREGTTLAGFETKVRLHIKPHIGTVKLKEVTSDVLDDLYRLLETAPCPTNKGKPLGKKSVRHVHNILSGALGGAVVKKLIPSNPARPRPRAPDTAGDQGAGTEVPDPGRCGDCQVPGSGVGAVREQQVRPESPLPPGRGAVDLHRSDRVLPQ